MGHRATGKTGATYMDRERWKTVTEMVNVCVCVCVCVHARACERESNRDRKKTTTENVLMHKGKGETRRAEGVNRRQPHYTSCPM